MGEGIVLGPGDPGSVSKSQPIKLKEQLKIVNGRLGALADKYNDPRLRELLTGGGASALITEMLKANATPNYIATVFETLIPRLAASKYARGNTSLAADMVGNIYGKMILKMISANYSLDRMEKEILEMEKQIDTLLDQGLTGCGFSRFGISKPEARAWFSRMINEQIGKLDLGSEQPISMKVKIGRDELNRLLEPTKIVHITKEAFKFIYIEPLPIAAFTKETSGRVRPFARALALSKDDMVKVGKLYMAEKFIPLNEADVADGVMRRMVDEVTRGISTSSQPLTDDQKTALVAKARGYIAGCQIGRLVSNTDGPGGASFNYLEGLQNCLILYHLQESFNSAIMRKRQSGELTDASMQATLTTADIVQIYFNAGNATLQSEEGSILTIIEGEGGDRNDVMNIDTSDPLIAQALIYEITDIGFRGTDGFPTNGPQYKKYKDHFALVRSGNSAILESVQKKIAERGLRPLDAGKPSQPVIPANSGVSAPAPAPAPVAAAPAPVPAAAPAAEPAPQPNVNRFPISMTASIPGSVLWTNYPAFKTAVNKGEFAQAATPLVKIMQYEVIISLNKHLTGDARITQISKNALIRNLATKDWKPEEIATIISGMTDPAIAATTLAALQKLAPNKVNRVLNRLPENVATNLRERIASFANEPSNMV